MIEAYNFLASWQLFPEKCTYESGHRPKSGFYKLKSLEEPRVLSVEHNWVTLENQAFHTEYRISAQKGLQPFEDSGFAEQTELSFPDSINLQLRFFRSGHVHLEVLHEILPNGYLRITQKGSKEDGSPFSNIEVYHKQMSVLPYAASVAGAVIKPTEEGLIRHKALTAMEEQTQMQMEQIRKQIELLALQAQEIQKRKELSLLIYGAQLNFTPVIGHTYYMYERTDGSHLLSLISPQEWGGKAGPYRKFIAAVKLLADHTWVEL